MRRGGLTVRIARNLRAFPRVQMRDVRSLPPAEVAIASILAAGLWALQTRSWRPAGIAHEDRQDQIDKPSIAYWRDHSAGASRRRVTINEAGIAIPFRQTDATPQNMDWLREA